MVICKSLDNLPQLEKSVVTIGSFDGMHCGHMEILKTVQLRSIEEKASSVVITFDPHPKSVLNASNYRHFQILTDIKKKIEILQKLGIDYLVIVPFDLKFAKFSAKEFLSTFIVNNFNPINIVIGYDHHFGNKQEGNADFLKKQSELFEFNVDVVKPLLIDNLCVSSTEIRKYLQNGEILMANKFLGWDYELSGIVVKGEGVGKELNFPTANIQTDLNERLVPGNGAYYVEVLIDNKKYSGMCNIGNRPTLYKNGNIVIEAHLITDDQLFLLNKNITIIFKIYLRKEKKYNNKKELVKQLEIDRQVCLSY